MFIKNPSVFCYAKSTSPASMGGMKNCNQYTSPASMGGMKNCNQYTSTVYRGGGPLAVEGL